VFRRLLTRWIAPMALLATLVGGAYAFSRFTLNPELAAYNQSLREEFIRVEASNGQLAAQIGDLKAEIHRLRADDAESLFHARTQLGMVKSGEVVYQLEVDKAPTPGKAAAPASVRPAAKAAADDDDLAEGAPP